MTVALCGVICDWCTIDIECGVVWYVIGVLKKVSVVVWRGGVYDWCTVA